MDLIIQITGIIGALFAFIAYQFNDHKKIMLFKTFSELTFAVQFGLLGAYTGLAMDLIGSVRNITFAILVSKNKNTVPFIILFAAIGIIVGAFTWISPISLLAIAGKTITTIAYGIKKPQAVRFFAFPGSICWMIYDIIYFSVGGIITETFAMASMIVATVRYYVLLRRKAKEQ